MPRLACRGAVSHLLVFLSLLAAGHATSGQAVEHDQKIRDMYRTRWTVRDGLPNSIWKMAQTPDGFLWLGTSTGLYRFDGVRFEAFEPSTGPKLLSENVISVFASSTGGLWIGYQFGGVSFLKDGQLTNYPTTGSPYPVSVSYFAETHDGAIWACVAGGLARFDGSNWKIVGKEWNYNSDAATFEDVDRGGTLWVSDSHTIRTLESGAHRFVDLKLATRRFHIASDRPGHVWLVNDHRLLELSRNPQGEWERRRAKLPGDAENILVRANGELWFSRGNRLDSIAISRAIGPDSVTDRDSQSFTEADGWHGIVRRIMEDREGGVWVLSTEGLDYFRDAVLKQLTPVDEKRRVIAELGVGDFLIGSSAASFPKSIQEVVHGQLQPLRAEAVRSTHSGPVEISCMYKDPKGAIWIGGRGHLWKFEGGRFTEVRLDLPPTQGWFDVRAMWMDHNGTFWVSLDHAGVYFIAPNREPVHWVSKFPKFLNIFAMFEDREGQLWMGGIDLGGQNRMKVLSGASERTVGIKDGFKIPQVKVIAGKGDHVWFGGSTGVQYRRGGQFYELKAVDDRLISQVSGLVETKEGDLWLNENAGIVRIASEEIKRALAQPTYRVHGRLFDRLDGTVGAPTQLQPLPSLLEASDGTLYLMSRDAITSLNPQNLKRNDVPPVTTVEQLIADGTTYRFPAQIRLHKNLHSLEVDYTASSLLIPQRVNFRYRLEPFDKDWIEAGTRRQAFYSKLPPGYYTFQVMAANNDGLWSQVNKSLSFDVPPAFTQTITFRLLSVVAVLFALWGIYALRIRYAMIRIRAQLNERILERERIARDLHDTFFQGIQGLLLRVSTASHGLYPDDPIRRTLEEVMVQSQEVMREGRELVLDLRSTRFRTDDLLSQMATIAKELQTPHLAAALVQVHGIPRLLNVVIAEEILKIGREALNNAYTHATARSIQVEINYDDRGLCVRFRDDGVGIDARVLKEGFAPGHFGLPGMKERAQRIGGRLSVRSAPNEGTEVELCIPASVAYQANWLTAVKRTLRGFLSFVHKGGFSRKAVPSLNRLTTLEAVPQRAQSPQTDHDEPSPAPHHVGEPNADRVAGLQ